MALAIGLVYDLKEDYLAAGFTAEQVMEFDAEETVAGIEAGLAALGHAVERVGHGRALAARLVAGDRFDLVFNVAEGVAGRSREAQVPALCELFGQPYTFADPLTCALTLDKAMAKRVVRDYGLPTPDFAVVEREADVEAVALEPPLFAKPVAEGSSKGVTARSFVPSREALPAVCAELLLQFGQPVLVERYLPGREVTVGVVGNGAAARVVGVMEVVVRAGEDTRAYTALNKKEWEERISYRLVEDRALEQEAARVALACSLALGCKDGARVDLRADEAGRLQFLEVNPLPGLNPVWSDLPIMARLAGHSYERLLGWIVEAACARQGI